MTIENNDHQYLVKISNKGPNMCLFLCRIDVYFKALLAQREAKTKFSFFFLPLVALPGEINYKEISL